MKRPLLITVFIGVTVIALTMALATHFRVFSSGVAVERPTPSPAAVTASPTASPDRSAQERASRYNNDLKAFTAPRPQK